MNVFQTTCTPAQIAAFYPRALTQNNWSGSFPAGATTTAGNTAATSNSASASPSASGNGTPASPTMPTAGSFVNTSDGNQVVAFINILPASMARGVAATSMAASSSAGASASGSPGASGGTTTYVEVIRQALPTSGTSSTSSTGASASPSSSSGTTSGASTSPSASRS
ncbi:MAG: hypothetical protein ACYDAG_03030 [Chloroflexota bacterium]